MVTSLKEILDDDKPCIGAKYLLNGLVGNNFHIVSSIVETHYSKKYGKDLTVVKITCQEEFPVVDENGQPELDNDGQPIITNTIISSAKAIISMFECCGKVNTALKNGTVIGPCKIIERENNTKDHTYQVIVPADDDTNESNNNG